MQRFDTNPFEAELEIVATMRDRAILARIAEAEVDSEFKDAIRSALQKGIDVNALSDASGLTTEQVRALAPVLA